MHVYAELYLSVMGALSVMGVYTLYANCKGHILTIESTHHELVSFFAVQY